MSALTQASSSGLSTSSEFRPIFVAGCQRSGTTALAVMLDRHSQIAMLPETQFFCLFALEDRRRRLPMTHEALAKRVLNDFFIKEANLDYESLVEAYRPHSPTYRNLFRALLEVYCRKHGKSRPAEKSCDHLFHTRELLSVYPLAKIICIVRDGRDVVRSIVSVGWNPSVPLPVAAYSRQWNRSIRAGRRLAAELPPERFTTVRYEDLMVEPERELRRLCAFLEVGYEPAQLQSGVSSDVVPQYELAWKGKAKDAPDPSRVAAWRKCGDPDLIAEMNYYMGPSLRAHGYPDTEVKGAYLWRRARWEARYFPFRRGIYPLARVALRAVRQLRGKASNKTPAEDVSK